MGYSWQARCSSPSAGPVPTAHQLSRARCVFVHADSSWVASHGRDISAWHGHALDGEPPAALVAHSMIGRVQAGATGCRMMSIWRMSSLTREAGVCTVFVIFFVFFILLTSLVAFVSLISRMGTRWGPIVP